MTLTRKPTRAQRWRLAVVGLVGLVALVGCGSADEPVAVSQTVAITATEYEFGADASTTIAAGETVRLTMTNVGTVDHEMQVLDTNARLIDRVERVSPGGSGDVVITFEEPGSYQLICDIDDHLSRGQRATFIVN